LGELQDHEGVRPPTELPAHETALLFHIEIFEAFWACFEAEDDLGYLCRRGDGICGSMRLMQQYGIGI
jgi:hypothetical protein